MTIARDRGATLIGSSRTPIISSRNNPRIKQIRGLRMRKERERTGLFFAAGAHLVAEAAHAQADIRTLVVAPDLVEGEFAQRTFLELCRGRAPCLHVTAEVFQSLADRETCGGLGAVVSQKRCALADAA